MSKKTLTEIRAALAAKECKLFRAALAANGWNQNATARALECRQSSLTHIINRHPELRAEIDRRLGERTAQRHADRNTNTI